MPLPHRTWRRLPSDISLRETLTALAPWGMGRRAHGEGASPFFGLREVRKTMDEVSYSLSNDSMRVAEEGIRGMINATVGATVTSYVMIAVTSYVIIKAALHILEELEESLSSVIEPHHAAKWT